MKIHLFILAGDPRTLGALACPDCVSGSIMIPFSRVRNVLASLIFNFVALFGAAQFIDGFSFGGDVTVLVFAALVLGAVNMFLKPILEAITIPLSLLTLGIFSIAIDASLLYLTARVVPGLSFTAFRFDGLQFQGINVPAFDVPVAGTLLLTAFIVSVFVIALGVIFGDD